METQEAKEIVNQWKRELYANVTREQLAQACGVLANGLTETQRKQVVNVRAYGSPYYYPRKVSALIHTATANWKGGENWAAVMEMPIEVTTAPVYAPDDDGGMYVSGTETKSVCFVAWLAQQIS